MNLFQYQPLPPDRSEIRLLKLQPGPLGAKLCIEIVHAKRASRPAYAALSYVWGCPDRSEVIEVIEAARSSSHSLFRQLGHRLGGFRPRKDTQHHHNVSILHISKNLLAALHHLRSMSETRFFWIDAISINQDDLAERSAEVLDMGAIYKSASHIIVWLGPSNFNSGLALHTLRRIGDEVLYYEELNAVKRVSSGWLSTFDTKTLIALEKNWFAVRDLLSRPWFTRFWVFQEIVLATKAVLTVGNVSLDWETAMLGLRWVWMISSTLDRLIKDLKLERLMEKRILGFVDLGCKFASKTLWKVLRCTRNLHCYDARDRLYAIRSLLDPVHQNTIVPNYSQSVQEVYTTFAKKWLFELRNADLLIYCSMPATSIGANLPTWVPDWSRVAVSDDFPIYSRCSGHSESFSTLYDGNRLGIQGVRVTSLTHVTSPAKAIDTGASALETCRSWMQLLAPKDDTAGITTMDDFVETIVAGCLWDKLSSKLSIHAPLTLEVKAILNQSASGADENMPANYLYRMTRVIEGRSFFKTAEGLFGLGPEFAKDGDCVAVLLGCPFPLILRPHETSREISFQIIGPCYISGIMGAEALLGKLPEGWTTRLESLQDGDRIIFANGEILTQQDPRKRLPPGWKYRYENSGSHYQEAKTLELMTRQWF